MHLRHVLTVPVCIQCLVSLYGHEKREKKEENPKGAGLDSISYIVPTVCGDIRSAAACIICNSSYCDL